MLTFKISRSTLRKLAANGAQTIRINSDHSIPYVEVKADIPTGYVFRGHLDNATSCALTLKPFQGRKREDVERALLASWDKEVWNTIRSAEKLGRQLSPLWDIRYGIPGK